MEEENRQPEDITEGNALAGKKKKKSISAVKTILGIAVCAILCAKLGEMGARFAKEMKVAENKAKYTDEAYVQQDILNYLKERYQEEFTLVENTYRGRGYAYDYVEVHAYPTVHQDEQHKFEVQGRYNEEGEMEYCDGYVMVKLTEEYEAYVDDIIRQYFDEYKFYMEFHSEWLTNNLPVDTKVEDLKNYTANIDYPLPFLVIYLPPGDEKTIEQCKQFITEMAYMQYKGNIQFKLYSLQNLFDSKTRNDWGEDSGRGYEVYSVMIMNDGSIEYFN